MRKGYCAAYAARVCESRKLVIERNGWNVAAIIVDGKNRVYVGKLGIASKGDPVANAYRYVGAVAHIDGAIKKSRWPGGYQAHIVLGNGKG